MKRKATQINMKENYSIVVEESIDIIENNLRNQGWAYVREINGVKYVIADDGFKYMFEVLVDKEN
mgnify:FL=1